VAVLQALRAMVALLPVSVQGHQPQARWQARLGVLELLELALN
jgi:hypothetical protein